MTIYHLFMESAVSPSSIKSILCRKSINSGIATINKLCDGMKITLSEFFDTDEFKTLEQEIK